MEILEKFKTFDISQHDLVSQFQNFKTERKDEICDFLQVVLEKHYDYCDILRLDFYKLIIELYQNQVQKRQQALMLLMLLTKEGRDLRHFEHDIGLFVAEALLTDNMLLSLATNLIKFSFVYLNDTQVTKILLGVKECYKEPKCHDTCINFLDSLIRYGMIPKDGVSTFMELIALGMLKLDNSNSWNIAKNLLNSPISQFAINTLLQFVVNTELSFTPAPPNVQSDKALNSVKSLPDMSDWRKLDNSPNKNLVLGSLTLIEKIFSETSYEFYGTSILIESLHTSKAIQDLQVVELVQGFVLKIIEKSEWVDWDGVTILYIKLAWIWSLPEKRDTSPDLERIDEQPKSVWQLNNLILKSLINAFSLSQISVSSKVNLLDCLLNLKVSPSISQWVMEVSSSYMWTDPNSYLVYFDRLLSSYFSKLNSAQTRMKAFSLFKEFYATRMFEELPLFPTITMKLLSILPVEESEGVSEAVFTWVLKVIPNMPDPQIARIIDIFLQTVCGVGVKDGQSLSSLWESIEKNRAVKNISHPANTSSQYFRLSITEPFANQAMQKLIELFTVMVNSRKTIQATTIYTWICRIVSWNEVAEASVRLIGLNFLASFSTNSRYQITYVPIASSSRVLAPFLTFGSRTNDPSRLLLPIENLLFSIIAILRYDPSHVILMRALEVVKLQLRNQVLWKDCLQIKILCETLISMITQEYSFSNLSELPPTLKKYDIFLEFYQILFTLFSYRATLPRAQLDAFVPAMIFGMGKWPPIAKHCVHGLNLALYELPQGIIRHLPAILMKISQVASSALAIPNLSFLASLASLPSLHVNFTAEDYKRVFGIALTYLRQRGAASAQQATFAYMVAQLWFLSLKLRERSKYVPMIVQTLLANTEKSASEELDLSVELVLDMMIQHTFIDCSPKPLSQIWPKPTAVPTKTWCQGNTLISLNVDPSGMYEIVFRRPVGVTVFESRLQNEIGKMNLIEQDIERLFPNPTATTTSTAKRVRSASEGSILGGPVPEELSTFALTNEIIPNDVVRTRSLSIGGDAALAVPDNSNSIDPTFLLLQFQPYPVLGNAQESPIPLVNDDSTKRALSVLDRTPSIDLHKIGVVFAGPGQKTEAEILSNTFGSEFYSKFLHGLGVFVPLANNRDIYTGGLDNSPDCFDGEYGLLFVPDPRLSQMIFHVTTMMPTSELDKLCTAKKRHIGNDFVNIIWNETGTEYLHDTIPGQFNLIQIIIEPLGSIDTTFSSANFLVTFWYRKDISTPPPLPIVVSGSSLASFVRQNAIYSNMIAQVFSSGEASSNAKERLMQIKRIKNRIERSGSGASSLDFTNLVVK